MSSVRPTHPDETFLPDLAPKEYWAALSQEEKREHPNVNDRMASTTDPEAAIITRASTGTILSSTLLLMRPSYCYKRDITIW